MQIVLISTYDLGHQPFGLASPAAWLREAGVDVICADVAIRPFTHYLPAVKQADLVAFFLPMHTATRQAIPLIQRTRRINPKAHLCAYGLYAPMNAEYLGELGIQTILGGEFEQGLLDLTVSLINGTSHNPPPISLARQQFCVPDRSSLPALGNYASLLLGDEARIVGYTQASRGCKHHCRHCPIVPVYNGRFRIIQPEVVLADIRQQVAAGAQHITFGDPDFLNGPKHAVRIVKALHAEFPELTYDVTIKISHLLQQADLLPVLKETNCLFVTSAVESVDDAILILFGKGHTRADFEQVVPLMQQIGLALHPTFVTFTPWTTAKGYVEFLQIVEALGLVESVSPIQYGIRLLIPAGSKLLELEAVQEVKKSFDKAALAHPWSHPDQRMDNLYKTIFKLIKASQKKSESRTILFERIWQAATSLLPTHEIIERTRPVNLLAVPTLSEDWY